MDARKVEVEAVRTVEDELEAARQQIITNHTTLGQRVTGDTADSLFTSVINADGRIVGTIDGRAYLAALETGTKPWANPYFRTTKDGRSLPSPPRWFREIIGEWLAARGSTFSPWLVAGKIMTEGSKLHREGAEDNVFSSVIPDVTKRIADRLAGLYDAQLLESILRK